MIAPPQSPSRWDYSPSEIIDTAKRLVKDSADVWEKVAAIDPKDATFENAILPIIHDEHSSDAEGRIIAFLDNVTTSEEQRNAARDASKIFSSCKTDRNTREDISRVIDAVYQKRETLDLESQVYLQKLRRAFVINGAMLDSEDKSRVKEIRKELSANTREYIRNLDTNDAGLWLTMEELKGVPDYYLDRWKTRADGAYWVNFKRPNFNAVMENAVSQETRKAVWIASENRLKDSDGPLLKQILLLRDEAARLLGYSSHADLIAEERMTKPQAALKFLHGLREKLTAKGNAELEAYSQLKSMQLQQDVTPDQRTEPSQIFLWDRPFFENLSKQKDPSLNNDLAAEYFPLQQIIPRMLTIFQALFGLRFELYPASIEQGTLWHEDVTLYAVWNDEDDEGRFLGYIYIDPYPRENKYSHFGNYSLLQGFIGADGEQNYPSSVFMANYSPPTASKPSLLKYKEVVNCFHELGHAIDNVICRTQYSKCKFPMRDFVEVPSILLEYFFWDPNIIRNVSGHYTDPTLKIPEELIQHLTNSNEANAALPQLHLIFQSIFDLTLHSLPDRQTLEDMDIPTIFNTMRKEIALTNGVEALGQGWDYLHGYSHFRAIVGYDVGYFTYVTSKAYAYDIFETLFKPNQSKTPTSKLSDIINPKMKELGRRYRSLVLEPGGSTGDQMELLKSLLGREPSYEAFGNLPKFRISTKNP